MQSVLPVLQSNLPCPDYATSLSSLFFKLIMTFKPDTVEKLRNTIDSYTQRPDGIPGLVYVAVDRDGNNIFSHASGKRGVGMHQDMDLETSFWIASCTKLVTAIAAMQLVEQGRVDLDSEEDIQRLLPELSRLQVIVEETNGELRLVDQERKITLRMLLTHTGKHIGPNRRRPPSG